MATPPDFTVGQVLTAAQMNAIGLWKITPTSVSGTGATIDSNGNVVVTSGGTNFTCNGVFSADFINYKIVISGFRGSGASGVFVSMGTSKTGTSHKFGGIFISSGGVVTSDSSPGTDAFSMGIVSRGTTDSAGGECTLYGPFLAQETSFNAMGSDSDNTGLGRFIGGRHMADTSYTACYFSTFGGINFTACTVSFYGYN